MVTTYIKPEPDFWNSVCIIELKSKKQNKKPQKSYTGIHPSTTKWAGIKGDILGVVVTSKCITPLRTWTVAGDILLQRPQRSGVELDFQISECITLTSLHMLIHKPSSILLQHPRISPCPSKATVSYKWPMFSPHLISAVCCLSDEFKVRGPQNRSCRSLRFHPFFPYWLCLCFNFASLKYFTFK